MRVLIAEDDALARRILESALTKWKYEVIATVDGEQAWKVLRDPEAPSLAVLDWEMPGLTGPEICRKFRALTNTRPVYILLLTAKESKDDLVAGLESGADDYISKPFNQSELKARLKVGERLVNLQRELDKRNRELKDINRQLEIFSSQDGLTGIYNRRHFDIHIENEWRRAMRAAGPISLIMIDIDYFKFYNDHCGHLGGDDCLKRVAKAILGCIHRGGDIVARYGGEEFAILLPNTTSESVMSMCHRMCDAVRDMAIPHPKSKAANVVTISLGAATIIPAAKSEYNTLIEQADKALYQAKENGRNRSQYFNA